MALPTIVKIYNRSDFTVQLPLADGYDGQEFRFTLYTCGEIENGWVASYIDGVYSNCTVDEDIVTVYVNNNNNMNPGCLTVQTEYDYFNGHFADNEDNVKDNYKTNIYLVDYQTNAFSASFRPSNLPDLTGTNDYVTFSDLEAMSYITADDVSQMGYVTNEQLLADLSGYATEAYVADYVATYSGNIDMSAYVTKDELNAAGYATKAQLTLKQDRLVSGTNIKTINNNSLLGSGNLEVVTDLTGYATESYVANYVDTHAPQPDLSAYVTKSELNAAGYISSIPSEYITESELTSELSSYAKLSDLSTYATQSYVANYVSTYGGNVDLTAYATKAYVAEYVATYAPEPDLSSYVTKTELNNAGYISSIPSEYITESELNSALSSYVTESELNSTLSSYITQDELSANGYLTQHQDLSAYAKLTDLNAYATKAYVAEYVAAYAPEPDLNSYVTKTELNNAGYISSIPSEYITETELSSALSSYATQSYVANYVATYSGNVDMSAYVTKTELNNAGYLTSIPSDYATYAAISQMGYITSIPSEYITQDELSANAYLTQHQDLSAYAKLTDLNSYVTKTELNNAGYLTSIPSDYATYAAISQMGYLTSIPSEYITQDELSANAYLTQHQDLSAYATKTYVAEYVAAYAPEPDLSSYVTKTELNNAGYITSIPSDYATYAAISQMGYLTSIPSEYITQDELSQMGYLTQHQDLSSYAKLTDLNSYVTKTELNNAGYLTSIPSDYATYAAISQMGYLTSIPSEYITESELNSTLSSYITQDELSANGYLTQHQDLSAYAKLSDLNSYVSKTELNNASYATQSYVSTYVGTYGGVHVIEITQENYDLLSQAEKTNGDIYIITNAVDLDLNDYVSYNALNSMGYITSSDLPVIDESIIPNTDNTYTLGNSSYRYNNVYAKNYNLATTSYITNDGVNFVLAVNNDKKYSFESNAVHPYGASNNKAIDLGISTRQWRTTYTEKLYINGYTGLSSYNFQYDSATNTLTITV